MLPIHIHLPFVRFHPNQDGLEPFLTLYFNKLTSNLLPNEECNSNNVNSLGRDGYLFIGLLDMLFRWIPKNGECSRFHLVINCHTNRNRSMEKNRKYLKQPSSIYFRRWNTGWHN